MPVTCGSRRSRNGSWPKNNKGHTAPDRRGLDDAASPSHAGRRLRGRHGPRRRRGHGRAQGGGWTWPRSRVLRALERRHQVPAVGGQAWSVPDRAGERLRRQSVADPDDPDRQGFRRDAGDQGEDQGVQDHLHRDRRRGAAGHDRGLHQSGLRRDRDHRGQPRGLRPGDPPRRPQWRGHRAVRQHPRHRRRDDGQRGPARHGRHVGRVPAQGAGRLRRPARCSRCAASPATRSIATGTSAFAR